MSVPVDALMRALDRLQEAVDAEETSLTRDAAIQRFEFCFELAWRAIQDRGRDAGLDCRSPKGCLRLAFKLGWITDEQSWLTMLEDRNLTSHTYDEATAADVYGRLEDYLPALRELLEALRRQ